MRLPWSAQFLADWWDYMSVASILRLRDFELRAARDDVRHGALLVLNMRRPIRGRVVLRETGSDILTFYEVLRDQVYAAIPLRLHACETIIDLGANIGLTSLYLAARYPQARIVAVEPNAETYIVLVENLRALSSAGRCRTMPAAVWSDSRALQPDYSAGATHYSAFAVRQSAEAPDAREGGAITGVTMPQIIERSGFAFVDLLKVDIEGAETELFKGDVGWLDRVGAIAIEFHRESRDESCFDRIVAERGFGVCDDGGHTVLAVR